MGDTAAPAPTRRQMVTAGLSSVVGFGFPRGMLLVWTSLAILPAALLAGHLSERFGRRPVFLVVGTLNVVALPVLVLAMAGYGPDGTGPLLGYGLLLTVFANASYAAVPIFLNEGFPTQLRATATAIVWNGGFAIGGLMTTFVSLASPTVADIPSRLAIFLAACVVLFLAGAALSRETRGALEREPAAVAAAPRPERSSA